MKIALVVAAGALALASGCATTTTSPPAATATAATAVPLGEENLDYAYIGAINNAAKASGVVVKWINYPQKRRDAVGVAPAQPEPTGT